MSPKREAAVVIRVRGKMIKLTSAFVCRSSAAAGSCRAARTHLFRSQASGQINERAPDYEEAVKGPLLQGDNNTEFTSLFNVVSSYREEPKPKKHDP